MCLVAKVLAVLAMLLLDFSVAHYSLYITEEHLQSYYSDTDHAELVQGEFFCICIHNVHAHVYVSEVFERLFYRDTYMYLA